MNNFLYSIYHIKNRLIGFYFSNKYTALSSLSSKVPKGLDHFGESAPYKVLDEKFGFTPEIVAKDILEFVKKQKK